MCFGENAAFKELNIPKLEAVTQKTAAITYSPLRTVSVTKEQLMPSKVAPLQAVVFRWEAPEHVPAVCLHGLVA